MSNIWNEFEGDNWFNRNKNALDDKVCKKSLDYPSFLIELYQIEPKKVLEIGAANGFRLGMIHDKFGSEVTAIEPSEGAIKDGKEKYPFIEFHQGTMDEVKLEQKFDLIIVNFVFHWVYRDRLFDSIANVDRMLENGGVLLIGDFGTDYFHKRKYHHIEDGSFYTWKMPYWDLFLKTGNYFEVCKIRFNHDENSLRADVDPSTMGTLAMLRKQSCFIEDK